ncbi:hypothetical protein QQP08_003630 [Theobroma cacao]|nr:hypothetical protein QQP08_003630 [Theobroma cacao]
MSVDPSATMNYVEDEASSGSGDDVNMLDGHKRQSATPSSSGRRKRSRKATGDAIVDAMLEIAAASKMRASAIMKNEDRFSISKCIKVLDEMQDKSTGMDDLDLELDEMELVAAAAGYYYYNCITRQTRCSSSPSGSGFMNEVLEGPDDLEGVTVDELPDFDEQPELQFASSIQEQIASSLRESIAAVMWNDFLNKWDQW